MSVTNLPQSGSTLFTTPDGRTVDNMQRSQTLVENIEFFIPHLHSTPPVRCSQRNIAITFGMKKKLETCGYPMVKKIEDSYIRFDRIHECDERSDWQTDIAWRQVALMHSMARQQKKTNIPMAHMICGCPCNFKILYAITLDFLFNAFLFFSVITFWQTPASPCYSPGAQGNNIQHVCRLLSQPKRGYIVPRLLVYLTLYACIVGLWGYLALTLSKFEYIVAGSIDMLTSWHTTTRRGSVCGCLPRSRMSPLAIKPIRITQTLHIV